MPTPKMITTFAGGELSPRILGRPDLPIYHTGLRTCENFLPFVQGGLQARPGTRYVASVKTAAERTRFIPFKFGTTTAYALEFGNLYFRVYYNNAGTYTRLGTVEVTTPYTTAQLQDIQFTQSNDVLYLAHPSHLSKKLSRIADDNWAIDPSNLNPPPTQEIKEAPDATITLPALTGNGLFITVSSTTFISSSDTGKIITAGKGRLLITNFVSTTEIIGDVIDDFDALTYTTGTWWIKGTPYAQLTPSAVGPVNADITLTADVAAFRSGADSLPTDIGKYVYLNDGIAKIIKSTNISTAVFSNRSKDVSGQITTNASSMRFKTDGTKLYVLDRTGEKVYQYALSTPWDVSTATYESKSFDTSTQTGGTIVGIEFKPDGTKFYIADSSNDIIYQYSMSTAWDISTGSYDSKSVDISGEDLIPHGIAFRPDGKKMYMVGSQNGGDVYQYSLNPAWDVSTATYDTVSMDINSEEPGPGDLVFSLDGSVLYIPGGNAGGDIWQYALTTAWDLSTGSYDSKTFDISTQEAVPQGIAIRPGEATVYICGNGNEVFQYALGLPTVATATVIKVLTAATATYNWTLEQPIWNATDGYPSTVVFHDDRLIWGGSPGFPQTVALSVVGDYENHARGANDADAFLATLNAREVNQIEWLMSRQDLIVGTTEAEWAIQAAGAFITPTDAGAKLQTGHGSKSLRPAIIDSSILFFQTLGRKLRELTFDFVTNGYTAPDISEDAEHITKGGIDELSYQKSPLSILWMVRNDGQLVGLTFDKGVPNKRPPMQAWHRHILGGSFDSGDAVVESVASIPHPTDDYDELWMIVKRTINSATVRYIEVLTKVEDSTSLADYWQVDSGKTFASGGGATSTITGMSHLEGETVTVFDTDTGNSVGTSYTVSGGEVDISPATVTNALVGLAFLPKMRPTKIVPNLRHTTVEAYLELLNTRGGQIGQDSTPTDNIDYGSDADTMFTGTLKQNVKSSIDRDGSLYITQNEPYPMTILSITPVVEGGNG